MAKPSDIKPLRKTQVKPEKKPFVLQEHLRNRPLKNHTGLMQLKKEMEKK